jgi:hypothetical protein
MKNHWCYRILGGSAWQSANRATEQIMHINRKGMRSRTAENLPISCDGYTGRQKLGGPRVAPPLSGAGVKETDSKIFYESAARRISGREYDDFL